MSRADAMPNAKLSATSGLLRLIRTVGSAMFGIRGRHSHEQDVPSLSPLQLIVTALVFMLIFVVAIVSIASYVAGH
jgi:ABC-type Na+ efflux pump permease subunit